MQYLSLYISYGTVALLVFLINNKADLWNSDCSVEFESPWKEFGYVFLCGLGIIAIGQMYMAGIRLPSEFPVQEAINQLFIFSPAILLLAFRYKSFNSAWIELKNAHQKILTGLGLAVTAILIYSLVGSEHSFLDILFGVYSPKNFPHLIQVLCEDILIAMLFIRLKKATSLKIALIAVASLFAVGHIPAMISKGFPLHEFYSLFLDAGLGFFLIYTINKTKDILWFWMVHFAMDMMQFYA